jgi:uncharacterized protein
MSGFVIDAATLPSGASRVVEEAAPRDLDLPEGDWSGGVTGSLTVEKTGERISVRGTVDATARLECVRCLRTFELPLHMPFEAFAERSGMAPRHEQESLERDAYMLFHDGRRLDLRPQVRDHLLVEIPIAPHCREDCSGLCPRCGADLNLGPHACPAA